MRLPIIFQLLFSKIFILLGPNVHFLLLSIFFQPRPSIERASCEQFVAVEDMTDYCPHLEVTIFLLLALDLEMLS